MASKINKKVLIFYLAIIYVLVITFRHSRVRFSIFFSEKVQLLFFKLWPLLFIRWQKRRWWEARLGHRDAWSPRTWCSVMAWIGGSGDLSSTVLRGLLLLTWKWRWDFCQVPSVCLYLFIRLSVSIHLSIYPLPLQFEDYGLANLDETAVNAIKLYCATADFIHSGYVMSSEGPHGEWKGEWTWPFLPVRSEVNE